jgi:hypothetical protein
MKKMKERRLRTGMATTAGRTQEKGVDSCQFTDG